MSCHMRREKKSSCNLLTEKKKDIDTFPSKKCKCMISALMFL